MLRVYKDIIHFWFTEIEPRQWWQKDSAFDTLIEQRFGHIHMQAIQGELLTWRDTALGSLAEIIVLDQFSRNIYRDKPKAFANDAMALVLAQVAIAKEFDLALPETQRSFMYLPFMHSESQRIHQQAVSLYRALGNAQNLEFEYKHKAIIDRFGRFPHRNAILGRQSTDEELEFLKQPDSGF